MPYDPRLDAATPEARKMTRRALWEWRWAHGSRWRRIIAAIFLAVGAGLVTSGCQQSICPPTVPGVGTFQGEPCTTGW